MKGLKIFLGGVAIGAIAGLLLAPEKGKDSRARIKECLPRKGLLNDDDEELDLLVETIELEKENAEDDKSEEKTQNVKKVETHKENKK